MSELSYGDCLRSNVKVENFKSQVFISMVFLKSKVSVFVLLFRLWLARSISLSLFSPPVSVVTMEKRADVTLRFSVNLG